MHLRNAALISGIIAGGALLLGTLPGRASAETEPASLLPSAGLSQAFSDLASSKGAQKDICRGYLARVQKEGLNEDERFALAELYFVSLMPGEAKALFQPFLAGNDLKARMAWQRMMRMNVAAYEDFPAVEKGVQEYRVKFPSDPRDLYDTYAGVQGLADRYVKAGEDQKVVDLILTEAARLPADKPYYTLALAGTYFNSFAKVGKPAEAGRILRQVLAAFEATQGKREGLGWPAQPLRLEEVKAPAAIHDRIYGKLKEMEPLFQASPPAKSAQP